jgi:hypothetical protein
VTLARVPLMINGADHPAQTFRMMLRDLARGNEGVTEGNDLIVTALSTPDGAVQVNDGSGVIKGRANTWQGHYTAYNIGTTLVPVAPTGASPRNDLLVMRVIDPEYEGSLDPAVDAIVRFEIVSGVGAAATAPPSGYSAIALARITIPPFTSTITQAMITDVRRIANPRRERRMFTASPSSLVQTSTADGIWRDLSSANWSVAVPTWATTARIRIDVSSLRFASGAAFGAIRPVFGVAGAGVGQASNFDDNQSGVRRAAVTAADTIGVLGLVRGTSQTLKAQMALFAGNTAPVGTDTATTYIADIEFSEETVGQYQVIAL